MSTPEPTLEIPKRAKRANWVHRLVGLNPFSWNVGPAIALPYWRSYTDQDDEGTMERWETVYVMLRRRITDRPSEPRAYFWRYDGRKRLVVNLPFRFFFCAGFDYADILLPNTEVSQRLPAEESKS